MPQACPVEVPDATDCRLACGELAAPRQAPLGKLGDRKRCRPSAVEPTSGCRACRDTAPRQAHSTSSGTESAAAPRLSSRLPVVEPAETPPLGKPPRQARGPKALPPLGCPA